MKKAAAKWIPFDEEKITVVNPKVSVEERYLQRGYHLDYPIFFYPAGDGMHKNHELIIEACKLLKEQGINDYEVVFTLDPSGAQYSKRMEELSKGLPIRFTGIIPKEEVFAYYEKSVLLFPSYLETFGLPLLEIRLMKGIALASDMPFSREALQGYENAYFYGIHDAEKLAGLMKKVITRELPYIQPAPMQTEQEKKTVIDCILG
jgi:glycosyltransferase involved in cell wall biosynthesis